MNFEQISFIQNVSLLVRTFGFCDDVADFIGCQFALESNFGRSELALKQHNYCGMKYPLCRITLANRKSSTDVFATYHDLDQCVFDYMLCLNYHQPYSTIKNSIQDFTFFIKKWYCPEKEYINRIINLYKNYKNGQTA